MVPKAHKAARGYKVHKDALVGTNYGTAARGAPKLVDEGHWSLLSKQTPDELPRVMKARRTDVHEPLLVVCDMVDNNHTVVFDKDGSFAVNKLTGQRLSFSRQGKKFLASFDLEAPEKANRVRAQVLAEMRETKRQEEAAKQGPDDGTCTPTTADKIVSAILSSGDDDEVGPLQGFPWAARPTRSV